MTPLPTGTLLLYGLPWLAVQLCFFAMTNLVPGFYAAELGVPLGAVAAVLLAGRLIDAVTDPLVGTLSDRASPRIGRRKLFVLIGVPVMMAGGWLLLVPPEGATAFRLPLSGLLPEGWGTASYLFLVLCLAFLGFTLVQIPYVSWGAELSGDYAERAKIAGWREGIGVFGTLSVIATLIVTERAGLGLDGTLRAVAVAFVVLLPLLMGLALWRVPEPAPPAQAPPPGFLRGLALAFENGEFRWLLAAVVIAFLGVAPGGATGYLMMRYAFEAEALYGLLVLAEFTAMLISVPFWAWAAGRVGKHRALAFGFGWMALFTLPVPLLIGQDPMIVITLTALRGLGFGAAFVLVYALLADVIDVDTIATGRQRSGLYMAAGGFFVKLALMAGGALALAWPAWFGFDQGAPTPDGAFHLAVSYAWISCAFWGLSLPLFWFYPLTRERQEALRARIDGRTGPAAAGTP